MNKNKIAIMVIIVIALIGLIYLNVGRIENALNLTKPALKITLTTGINESLGEDLIQVTNMTFEQTTVPIFYRSADSPAEYPDIDIEARANTVTAPPASYWVSFKRVNQKDKYNFVMTFREPYVPQAGDMLFLTVRMNDFRGVLEYKSTAFYSWR